MVKGIYYAPWERSFERILTPLEEFIHRQTTSGILLMICAVIALGVANSPLHDSYEHFLHTQISFGFGALDFSLSVHHWINEALMALFFLVMGLELKREMLVGELSSPRQALLPIMAAIGGMGVPALFYFIWNPSAPGVNGWGIPMATDIAFAIGALSLLGARIPTSLVTFLIALAIVDDLGAVAVIAFFYTNALNFEALLYAGFCMVALVVLNLGGVRHSLPYLCVGVLLWLSMLISGIHATIAGIVLAFTVPIRPKFEPAVFLSKIRTISDQMEKTVEDDPDIIHNAHLRGLVSSLRHGVHLVQAPAQRAEHALHFPVAYIIIPIFALANAGIPIDFSNFGQYLSHSITLGVMAGLLLGKPLGIVGFTWVTVKLGWANLPEGLNFKHILGVGLLGGIGFTMSIFVADLGFLGLPEQLLMAKTGILLASLLAGLSGFFLLKFLTKNAELKGAVEGE